MSIDVSSKRGMWESFSTKCLRDRFLTGRNQILRVIKQERFGIFRLPQDNDWLGTPGGKRPQAPLWWQFRRLNKEIGFIGPPDGGKFAFTPTFFAHPNIYRVLGGHLKTPSFTLWVNTTNPPLFFFRYYTDTDLSSIMSASSSSVQVVNTDAKSRVTATAEKPGTM